MFLITSITILSVSFVVYWYVNRQKKFKYLLSDVIVALDIQGAGAGGIIDDCISVRKNKIVLPDARNKVAVITGGARGIGLEVIRELLKANVTVVMGVRNPNAVKSMKETMKNGDKIHAYPLDLMSLQSVKEFSENVLKEFTEIHLLINNAGIMFGDYKLTEDGVEMQFAVNYLSHFYLTHLLLPALKSSGKVSEPARIVNVSSCAHYAGKIYFDDINMKEHYNTAAAYAQSKLAQVMMARYVNKIMEEKEVPVKCYSVHPGIVDTDLFENSNFMKFPWMKKIFFKTPEKGAIPVLHACFDQDILSKGGLYISNCKEGISNRFSKNEIYQEKIFKLSCNLIGIETHMFGRN